MVKFTQNSKMKASSTATHRVVNWTLPAAEAVLDGTRVVTCPQAGACRRGCYATQGAYVWPAVRAAHVANLRAALAPDFASRLAQAVQVEAQRAAKQSKTLVVRVHDSGDFFSRAYVLAWWAVAAQFPNVVFYAYTKSRTLLESCPPPPANFRLVWSEGGRRDAAIDYARDFHSRVFATEAELVAAGYADASNDDLVAALGTNHRIGLIYHGQKGKAWTSKAA